MPAPSWHPFRRKTQSCRPGLFQAGPERVSVRVSGEFASEESLKAINLRINDRFFPLTDVVDHYARVRRSADHLGSALMVSRRSRWRSG